MIDYQKVFDKLDQLEERYIKIWEEFCLIESPTDYKEGVDNASDYIVQIAEKFGCRIERQKQNVSGDCICITMNPDLDEAPVCLSGHVDTVHPVGLFKSPVVRFEGNKIFGPGAGDCKGGIVACLYAMEALYSEGYNRRPIKLILQSDEETSSAGSNKTTIDYMCECAKDAVAFLNCEPNTSGTVMLKRKGIAKYSFNVTGKAVHASRCFSGISAIAEAAHKIIELEKYKDEHGITASCGLISGGTKINTVPENCNFKVDFRFSNSDELSKVNEIAKKVAETSYIEGTTCELTLESLRDAMELTDKNIRLLDKVNDIFEKTGLPTLTYRATTGGSDAAYTTQRGIPTLDSLGVMCGGIHSKDECAILSSLKEAARRIAAICCYI